MIDLKKLAALVLPVAIAVYLARRWQPRSPILYKTIALGAFHSCAIKHGDVWCWGYAPGYTSSVPRRLSYSRNSRLAHISTSVYGLGFTCLLERGGTMQCGSLGREMQPMPGRWYTFGVGRDHMCAIDLDRKLWCFGSNAHGQIGNLFGMPYPVSLKNTHTDDMIFDAWAALAVGYNHTCGLDQKGELYCWGLNSKGQLGDGTAEDNRFHPHVVVGDTARRWKSVCAGATYSCGISSVGVAYCWGGGDFTVLGDGRRPSIWWQRKATPVRVQSDVRFASITCGACHTCALTNGGEAYCWGKNDNREVVPDLSKDYVLTPTRITGHHGWQELVAGAYHTCGVKKDGSVWCWGWNEYGQLGFGSRDSVNEPVKVHQSWPAEDDKLRNVVLTLLLPAILWMWWKSPRPVPPGEVAIFVEAQIGPPGPDGIPHRWDYHLSRHPSSDITRRTSHWLGLGIASLPHMYASLYHYFCKPEFNMSEHAASRGAAVITLVAVPIATLPIIITFCIHTVAIIVENAVKKLAGAIDTALYQSVGLPLQVVSEAVLEVATQLRHVVTSLENIGQSLQAMQNLMREILAAQREEGLTRRFQRRCVDLLFLGILVGSVFLDIMYFRKGAFLGLARETCPPMDNSWYHRWNLFRPIMHYLCWIAITVSSLVVVVLIVIGPVLYIALYRARDHLIAIPLPFVGVLVHLFLPDILEEAYSLSILGSLGIFGGCIGGVVVGFLHGNWHTWLVVWLTWILLFMMAFMHAHQWGPAIMPNTWKQSVWCLTMGIIFPILSIYS